MFFLGLIFSFTLSAQLTEDNNYNNLSPDNFEQKNNFKTDSSLLKYFTLNDIRTLHEVTDTLFTDFEKYNPTRDFENGALTLGNLGSSHQKIIYTDNDNINTDPGFHQYDLYKIKIKDFRFYELNRPYNDLYFSPVGGQRNFLVKAKFSRDFANEVNLSLDFMRINQVGFYNDQNTKSTRFGVGLWKHNAEKGRHTLISFFANNHNEKQNGGITTDTLFGKDLFRLRTAIPTRLSKDTTRHQHFTYSLDNYFDKVGDKYSVHHQIQYESGYFRYGDHDVSTSEDSLVYKSYLTDSRGVRYFKGFSKINNTLDLSFIAKSVDLRIGLLHSYNRYNNNIEINHINDLSAFADMAIRLKNISTFRGHAAIGFGSNAGNLKLRGQLDINPVKNILLKGIIKILRYDPSLLQQKVYITNQLVYDNQFNKLTEIQIGGKLIWTKMDTRLEFKTGIIDNAIAYNSDALPYQLSESVEYVQFKLSHRLKWRFLGIENSVVIQKFTNNVYQLPKFYSIHNAYIQTTMFKKRLLTRMGLLVYIIKNDGALRYMPATGIFYPGGDSIKDYTYSEFYANFKIDRFRLFFKIDNLTDLISKEVHYQITDYPQFDYKMRIGVQWQIRD